jgi:hypothetical protein
MGLSHLVGGIGVIWRTTLAFVLRRMGEHLPARATTRPMRKMLCK